MFIRHYHDVELEQFEREAGLAINANSELFQTDPSSLSKDQIDKTKSLTFQAGKLAHSSKRISAPVRAYWEAHFLIATAMIDGHFLKDYQKSQLYP